MTRTLLVGVLALGVVSACGGGNSSPTPVIPNFGGNWSGVYAPSGCTQSGGVALANICGQLSSSAPYAFALSQNGSTVSGSFTLGSITFLGVSGVVSASGGLSFQSTSTSSSTTVSAIWNLTLPSPSTLAGTVAVTLTSSGLTGSANYTGTITTATHSVALPTVAPARIGSIQDVMGALSAR